MAIENIDEKIKKEEKKLAEMKATRDTLNKKIKKSEQNLDRYNLMKNSNSYISLMEATKGTGVAIDDILFALQNGDLSRIQEQIVDLKMQKQEGGDGGELDS